MGAFKFNKDITKPTNGKLVSEIQMETILFNDNQQHSPSEAVTELMPAIFLRELSSEMIPAGLTQAPDPDGAEQGGQPALLLDTARSSWPHRARPRHVAKGLITCCVMAMALLNTPELAKGPQIVAAAAVSSSLPHTIPTAGRSRL